MKSRPIQVCATSCDVDRQLRKGNTLIQSMLKSGGFSPDDRTGIVFLLGEAESRLGKATTAPSPGSVLVRFTFGFVSCTHYEHGYFSAYRHLADENPDLVLFLGDYIYEGIDRNPANVRTHSDGVEASTLSTYRNRYAQYRLDPDLQRLHAEVPALITW